jgi:hypothetical protein
MTLSKIYKAITFTTIISLNLATASSSVKAATLTSTSQSGVIQLNLNNNITINDLSADVLSIRGNNPGIIITADNGVLTPTGVLTVENNNLTDGSSISPAGGSGGSISPAGGSGGSISLAGGEIRLTVHTPLTLKKSIPEPTSLKSFAILGLGCLLLRFKKIPKKNKAN